MKSPPSRNGTDSRQNRIRNSAAKPSEMAAASNDQICLKSIYILFRNLLTSLSPPFFDTWHRSTKYRLYTDPSQIKDTLHITDDKCDQPAFGITKQTLIKGDRCFHHLQFFPRACFFSFSFSNTSCKTS